MIKKFIPEKIKISINLLKVSDNNPYWIYKIDKTKKNAFVFLAGFYQNLGDMALTYSQVRFLKSVFPDANIVAVPSTCTYEAVKTLKNFVSKEDIITIIGGGNMDDIYTSLEAARLYVVKNFPKNRIISFPQTVAFSDTPFGRKKSKQSYKVYSSHKNLKIFVREPNSLEYVKKYFKNVDIGYCPDIVLSLNKVKNITERTDVMCCLRSDKEQNLSNEKKDEIVFKAKKEFDGVQFTDTVDVALEDCTPERYEETLENFWDKLRKCRVVITDRLHCMIFCAITGTPCVAFDNSNHKITGVFNQWLQNIEYIKIFSNDEIDSAITKAKEFSQMNFNVDKFDLNIEFKQLKDSLLN